TVINIFILVRFSGEKVLDLFPEALVVRGSRACTCSGFVLVSRHETDLVSSKPRLSELRNRFVGILLLLEKCHYAIVNCGRISRWSVRKNHKLLLLVFA